MSELAPVTAVAVKMYLELYTSVKFIYFGHYDVRPENKMKVFA